MATKGGGGRYDVKDGSNTDRRSSSSNSLMMECAVCLEGHRHPVELPCYHTFCQKCLQDVAGSDPCFPCPSCRAEVILPPGGVLALPVQTVEETEKKDFGPKPPDYNLCNNISRTMTRKFPLSSSKKRCILITLPVLLSVALCVCMGVCLWTGRMTVDPCDKQMWECETGINAEMVATTALYQNFQDFSALQSQCRKLGAEVITCVAEVQSVCSLTAGINTTILTWQSALHSMCRPDVICDFEAHSCIPSSAVVDEINNATQQSPPDVDLLAQKCRALTERVGQCVEGVKGGCSNVTSVAPTLSSILSTLHSLCGAGAVCNLEVQTCSPNSSVITEINAAKQQSPPDVSLVTDKCRALTERVGQCVEGVKGDCSNVTSVAPTLSSILSTLHSLCGADAVCNLQALNCAPSNAVVKEIIAAEAQMPPDVNLVTDKCRTLKASVGQCVSGVKEQCSNVARASSTLTSIENTANALCGTEALCQLKVVSCKVSFKGVQFLKGKERIAFLCRIQGQVRHCLYSEMDESCLSLPKINQDTNVLTSTLASVPCSGGKRVMESFTLILLMAAVTAWASTPFL